MASRIQRRRRPTSLGYVIFFGGDYYTAEGWLVKEPLVWDFIGSNTKKKELQHAFFYFYVVSIFSIGKILSNWPSA